MYHKPTKNSGNTSLRCTRTPTKASKAEARTEGYPHCLHQPLLIPLPTPQCLCHPCIEAFLEPTNTTVVTAVAAAHRCPQTQATIERSPTTTSTLPSRPATRHMEQAMMTWCFLSERCTKFHRACGRIKTSSLYTDSGMVGVYGHRGKVNDQHDTKLVQRGYISVTFTIE
jgi:hypothetical protein